MTEITGRSAHIIEAETARRSGILRRYLAHERPDAATDEKYAAELGLSVDSLIRMASTMRRHGASVVRGARIAITPDMRLDALASLERPVDMSGVAGIRLDETRRRLDIIRRHLALPAPTKADRDAAAAEMGVDANRFRKIVRAWILLRSATAIPGATTSYHAPRRNLRDRDRDGRLTERALDELGHDARGTDVHARVLALSAETGTRPPSRTATYDRLRRMRADRLARHTGR